MRLVRFRIGRNKKERNLVIGTCICIVIALLILGILHSRNTWKEDVDGDGVEETVNVIQLPSGERIRSVIYGDGTVYQTEYMPDGEIYEREFNPEGQVVHLWRLIPDPDNPGEYTIHIWDKETEQWLLDQDQDGIPDELEKLDDSSDNCS